MKGTIGDEDQKKGNMEDDDVAGALEGVKDDCDAAEAFGEEGDTQSVDEECPACMHNSIKLHCALSDIMKIAKEAEAKRNAQKVQI